MKTVGPTLEAWDTERSLVEHGAVKFANQLTAESIHQLQQGVPTHLGLLIHKAPELELVFGRFGLTQDSAQLPYIYDAILGPDDEEQAIVHQDSRPVGLTFLIPHQGPQAVFAASNQHFSTKDMPTFTERYGPGDVMVVRQAIHTLNGRNVTLDKAYHVGFAPLMRRVIMVDWAAPDLTVLPKPSLAEV